MDGVGTLFSMTKARRARRPGLPVDRRGDTTKPWSRIFLKEWRKVRGLSTEKLAAESGVSSAMISLIERRKSGGSPESLEKLAKALGCEVGELLDVKPAPGGSMVRMWVDDGDLPRLAAVAKALADVKKQQ